MSYVTWHDLLAILAEHPERLRGTDVPAKHALWIQFGPGDPMGPGADMLETVTGEEIAVFRGRDGRVSSIEIL